MPLQFFNNASSGGGGSVPFQRMVEPNSLSYFLNLEQSELLRVQRYNEAWRFYFGRHWSYAREDGEPLVTLNYIQKFIDKHAEFLVGKGFVITVADALEDTSLPYLNEVWSYNFRDKLAWEMALTGGVTGDVFVLVTDEDPTEIQKKVYPFSQGKTRINLLGSEQVFPTWDPLNTNVLTSVRIETIYYSDRGRQPIDRDDRANHEGRQLQTKRFTQIITPNQILEQFHGEIPMLRGNPLGEIPLVHIQNIAVPKEYYGMSDCQSLFDLQRELNEKSTDISDTINYHSSPITVITGAKAKNLERGPRQIWAGLPADAAVFNLQLNGDLPAAQNYWDKIKRSMHEIGDIPEGILGQTQPISNTSGVALHIQYQPIVARSKRKRATYQPGIEQINYFILRIGMLKGRINLPFDICKHCGGRVLEIETDKIVPVWDEEADTYADRKQRVKRCFRINKQTLDFEDPEKVKIKIWREYGFGGNIIEVPMSEAREIAEGAVSYWDYAVDNASEMEAYNDELREVRAENYRKQVELSRRRMEEQLNPPKPKPRILGPDGQPVGSEETEVPESEPGSQLIPEPQPPVNKVKRLPIGDVDVPAEPEKITVHTPLYHPRTGEVVRVVSEERFLIPTDCQRPSYLNPFENFVEFNDVLPKDEALQAQLFQMYQTMTWVDAEWCQDQIPAISADKLAIQRRQKSKQTRGLPQPYMDAMTPPTGAVTDLAPAEQPLASQPGPGGNPVAPGTEE